ncbi:lysine--tRNA ligase [Clostridia bacterium]|nr:lysine--tRNA ligase [Clostridia bacterium]
MEVEEKLEESNIEELNELMQVRREKLAQLYEEGIDPFGQKFEISHKSQEVMDDFDALEGKTVSLAGRIMAKRGHGKASFANIQDLAGRIQIYVRLDRVGENNYALFNKLDIGDIIGLTGEVFKTQRGEISVKADSVTLLSKSLRPLPEKFHGLKDVELRYRQRYVDLIMNPEVKDAFIVRSRVIKAIRDFLDGRDFLEVETPILHPIPGGAAAKPFVTHHNALDMRLYNRISLELHLKRLLVGGLERVYEMGRVFRNEGISTRHNPEFTLLELYQAYANVEDMMEITESMVEYACETVLGTKRVQYGENQLDFTAPWNRMTMIEAVKKYTGVDFESVEGDEAARKIADSLDIHVEKDASWGIVLNEVFEEKVESELIQPTIIYDYPLEISPLAKKIPGREHMVYRFEAFVAARELANAFTELNDPLDQRERFLQQVEAKAKGDEEAHPMDEDYIQALEYGMPPAGGMGIGIDRLIMLLTDAASIRDVLLYPTMREK